MTTTVRPRHRTAAAAVTAFVALVAVSLTACGSGGEAPGSEPDRARTACTAVLEERSEAVSRKAVGASTDVLHALEAGEAPPDDELAAIRDALGAERGQLADARDNLADVDLPPSDRADWRVVVESVDASIANLDALIEFLRDPDWERDPTTVGLGAPTPDRVGVEAALDALGLRGSDCEWVYDHPGEPRETAPFQHDAAAACATAVERRRAEGDPTAAEWEATVEDLEAVDTGALEDPGPWESVVDAARDRANGEAAPDVTDDLAELGLDQRPCAALGL